MKIIEGLKPWEVMQRASEGEPVAYRCSHTSGALQTLSYPKWNWPHAEYFIIDTSDSPLPTDYKEGLRLAKKFIEAHVADPDLSDEMVEAHLSYLAFLEHYDLEDL